MGLRELAVELSLSPLDIFTDPSYIKSNQFTLSTSQVCLFILSSKEQNILYKWS